MIAVENITKEFIIQKRSKGRFAVLRDLFNRQYETKIAVRNISFSVDEGEMVAYIGPNGSGKSTTIKMLSGILVPTAGNISVNGIVPYKNRKNNSKRIGVVFGQRTQLWWDIPVSESLNLLRYIYKIPDEVYNENINRFSEILDLKEFVNTPVRQLSLGQRMRADLCASLLHNPRVLYLDEPTIGLDIVVKQKIRAFIKDINEKRKTTIILTTHDISDIVHLCKRVIVIEKGAIKYDGLLEDLISRYGKNETIIVKLAKKTDPESLEKLHALGVTAVKINGEDLVITYDSSRINSMGIIQKLSGYAAVVDFKMAGVSIEDVIAHIYQEE
jgi:ABC-2 type transport system ATP-binding protein